MVINSIKRKVIRKRQGFKPQGTSLMKRISFYLFCTLASSPLVACTPYLCRMKILMVCLGNICRSPLAEGILREKALKAGLSWQIDSAGTNGYHTGEPPHHLSIK